MSKDPVEYLRGCDGLHNLLNVDGHTMIDIAKSAFLDTSKVHEDLYKRYRERSGSKRVQSAFDDKTTGKHMEAEIYDYSSFYDVGVLNEVMNELF